MYNKKKLSNIYKSPIVDIFLILFYNSGMATVNELDRGPGLYEPDIASLGDAESHGRHALE